MFCTKLETCKRKNVPASANFGDRPNRKGTEVLGNTSLTVVLGSTPPNTADEPVLLKFTRELCKLHLPVLLIQPGTKLPLDMRSSHEKKQDPRSGVHMATDNPTTLKKYIHRARRDASEKRPKTHPAPLEPNAPLNFAVRLRGSGYVVVDADTPQEVEALKRFLAPEFGGVDKVPSPTVLTPGGGGHSGGGHWWFKLPDTVTISDDMPAVHKVTTEHGSFSVYLNDAYVLIPPSTRPEGSYVANAPDNPLPITLAMELKTREVSIKEAALERQRRAEERAAHLQAGDFTLDQSIAEWAQSVTWEELLTRHGWHSAGTVDGCGCGIFTRPGAPSSPKSATAHEASCSLGRYDAENAPLHVWTDNAPDEIASHIIARNTKTISKLTFVALMEHGGDMTKAINALGIKIPMDLVGVPLDLAISGLDSVASTPQPGTVTALDSVSAAPGTAPGLISALDSVSDPVPTPAPEPMVEPAEVIDAPAPQGTVTESVASDDIDPAKVIGDYIYRDAEFIPPRMRLEPGDYVDRRGRSMWTAWRTTKPGDAETQAVFEEMLPPIGEWTEWLNMPPLEWDIDGMVVSGGLSSIIGAPGVGKSFVALDMLLHMATGTPWQGKATKKQKVMYVAGEGVSGAVRRIAEWERRHNIDLSGQFFIIPQAVTVDAPAQIWAHICACMVKFGITTVAFDTLSRMIPGTEENSAKEMSQVITIFDRVRTTTGAGVMLVHHTSKNGTSGRGSSALLASLDSQLLVQDDTPTTKDGKPDKSKAPDDDVSYITVTTSKVKDGPKLPPFDLSITKSGDTAVVTDRAGNLGAPTLGLPDGQPAPVEALTVEEQLAAARAEIEQLKAAAVPEPVAEPPAEVIGAPTPNLTVVPDPEPEPAPTPVTAPVMEQAQLEPDVSRLFGVPSMVPELVEEPEPEPAPFTPTHRVEGLTDAQLELQVTTPNPMLAALAQMELDKRRAVQTPPPAPVTAPEPVTAPLVAAPEPVQPPVNPAALFGTPSGTTAPAPEPVAAPPAEVFDAPAAPQVSAPEPVPALLPAETVQAPLQPFGAPPVAVSPFLNPPPQVPAGLDFEGVTSQVSSIVFGKLTGQPPWETVTVTDVLAELRTNVPLDGDTATKLVTYLLGELATVGKLTQASKGTYRLRT